MPVKRPAASPAAGSGPAAGRAPARTARRRDTLAARTREDILLAAARMLGRSGWKSVSLTDIAAELGFTAPAIYVYFESKEAIFVELARTLGRELEETFALAAAPPGTGLREQLATLVRRQLEWGDRRREVFAAFLAQRMRGEDLACSDPAVRRAFGGPGDYLGRLTAWMRQAVRRPADLSGVPADEAACLLMGVMHGFFVRWLVGQPSERLADQADRIVEFFFHGVSGSPAAGSSSPERSSP
jgi:AcrR family transcriptional regulator